MKSQERTWKCKDIIFIPSLLHSLCFSLTCFFFSMVYIYAFQVTMAVRMKLRREEQEFWRSSQRSNTNRYYNCDFSHIFFSLDSFYLFSFLSLSFLLICLHSHSIFFVVSYLSRLFLFLVSFSLSSYFLVFHSFYFIFFMLL